MVVFLTFLVVYFACLKEGTLETRKMFFYFTLKALFILEIYHDIIKYLSMKHETHFTEELIIKHSLVVKFDQFM